MMNDFLLENNTENLFDVLDKEEQKIEFNDGFINNKSKLIDFDNNNVNDLSNNDDDDDDEDNNISKLTKENKNEKQILFKCDKCPRICKRKGDFQKHLRTHTGEKPFKCNSCDKSYATQTSLKLHERSVHCGERPYKCDYCDKTFTNLTNYKNHVRIHTGEKPYKCNLCSRAFTEHSTLYKHQLTHSKEKKYICNICGNSYRQVSSLRSHSRTVHSVDNTQNAKDLNDNELTNSITNKNSLLSFIPTQQQQQQQYESQKSMNSTSKRNCYLIKLKDKPAIDIIEVLNDKSIKKVKIINNKTSINLNDTIDDNDDKLTECLNVPQNNFENFMRDNDKLVSNIENLHDISDGDYIQKYRDYGNDDDKVINNYENNDDDDDDDDTVQSYSIDFDKETNNNNCKKNNNNNRNDEENKNSQILLTSTQPLSQLLIIPSNDFMFNLFN